MPAPPSSSDPRYNNRLPFSFLAGRDFFFGTKNWQPFEVSLLAAFPQLKLKTDVTLSGPYHYRTRWCSCIGDATANYLCVLSFSSSTVPTSMLRMGGCALQRLVLLLFVIYATSTLSAPVARDGSRRVRDLYSG